MRLQGTVGSEHLHSNVCVLCTPSVAGTLKRSLKRSLDFDYSFFGVPPCRVVHQLKGERSYHIFYQLVRGAGPELRQELCLPSHPTGFRFLAQSGCTVRGVSCLHAGCWAVVLAHVCAGFAVTFVCCKCAACATGIWQQCV